MYYFIAAAIGFWVGVGVDRLYLILRDAADTFGAMAEGRRPSDEVRNSMRKVGPV
jgi:hypothetical protein